MLCEFYFCVCVILGGFSMGGSLSFHVGFRWEKNLAGTFVFSSFLNNGSTVYQELKNNPGAKSKFNLLCYI